MYIKGFGGGWRPGGHRAERFADKHGWEKTGHYSWGDEIMYARGHMFEYLAYTYNAGGTLDSCIVKRKIRGSGWHKSSSSSMGCLVSVGILVIVTVIAILEMLLLGWTY